jgi:putative PIN family toxin of toxin-antitoxin system
VSAGRAVVLDTNVVLDLLLFEDPQALPLLRALEQGALEAWASARTLAELQRVLAYPAFRLAPEAQAAQLARYRGLVQVASEEEPLAGELPRCADREDQKFLELAARVGATWLVSKDKQLLQLGGGRRLAFQLLRPAQAAALLGP